MTFVQPSTGESTNDAENIDNTLHGAEDGMFGGFFDAYGNDANGVATGTFSPPSDDLPTFFISLIMVKEVV